MIAIGKLWIRPNLVNRVLDIFSGRGFNWLEVIDVMMQETISFWLSLRWCLNSMSSQVAKGINLENVDNVVEYCCYCLVGGVNDLRQNHSWILASSYRVCFICSNRFYICGGCNYMRPFKVLIIVFLESCCCGVLMSWLVHLRSSKIWWKRYNSFSV